MDLSVFVSHTKKEIKGNKDEKKEEKLFLQQKSQDETHSQHHIWSGRMDGWMDDQIGQNVWMYVYNEKFLLMKV